MQQMGWQSGISNSTVVIATFVVGWLIQGRNWHLPFIVYLAAGVPLIFSFWLKNVPGIHSGVRTQPAAAGASDTADNNVDMIETPQQDADDVIEVTAEEAASLSEKAALLSEKAADMTREAAQLTADVAALAKGENVPQQEIETLKEKLEEPINIPGTAPKVATSAPAAPQQNSLPDNANIEVPEMEEVQMNKGFNVGRIWGLIGVYFFITFTSIAITNYCSQLTVELGWPSSIAGDVTAIFFLFVLIPGYVLTWFVKRLRGGTFFWTALMILVGLGLFVFVPHKWAMFVGAAFTGLGYGICQPMLYDKASYTVNNPAKVTLALAFVLTANYLAIAIQPFVISGVGKLFHVHDENTFAFSLSFALVAGYTILTFLLRKKFAFTVDKSYYEEPPKQ